MSSLWNLLNDALVFEDHFLNYLGLLFILYLLIMILSVIPSNFKATKKLPGAPGNKSYLQGQC